jgi:heme/copper-type cytochrome/quinol oxidase subunit 3
VAGDAVHVPHTATGLDNRKLGMWAFLGSECLFFGSLIATYLLYRGRSVQGPFPEDVYDIPYTSVSSFVLLMSSLTMVLALAALRVRQIKTMMSEIDGLMRLAPAEDKDALTAEKTRLQRDVLALGGRGAWQFGKSRS